MTKSFWRPWCVVVAAASMSACGGEGGDLPANVGPGQDAVGVIDATVEDHFVGFVEGAVGVLEITSGPEDELGIRAIAFPYEEIEPAVWSGSFDPLELPIGDYTVEIWMLGCNESGCETDPDLLERAARRPEAFYRCMAAVALDEGQHLSITAAIGPQGCIDTVTAP